MVDEDDNVLATAEASDEDGTFALSFSVTVSLEEGDTVSLNGGGVGRLSAFYFEDMTDVISPNVDFQVAPASAP